MNNTEKITFGNKIRLKDGAIKFALTLAKYVLIVALSIAVSSFLSYDVAKWVIVGVWGVGTVVSFVLLGVLKLNYRFCSIPYSKCKDLFNIIQIKQEQLKGKSFDEVKQIKNNYTKQIKRGVSLSSLKGMAIFDCISLVLAIVLFFAFNNFTWGIIMRLAMFFELCTVLIFDAIISLWCYLSYEFPSYDVIKNMEDSTCSYGWSKCPNCGGLIVHTILSINSVTESHSRTIKKGSSYTTVSIDKPTRNYMTNTVSVNYSTSHHTTPDKTEDYQTTTLIGESKAVCLKCDLTETKKGIIPHLNQHFGMLGEVVDERHYLSTNGEQIKINKVSPSSINIKEYKELFSGSSNI